MFDTDDGLGQLVPRDVALRFGEERCVIGVMAIANSHHSHHLATPPVAQAARNDTVVDCRMGFDCGFDLFCKDFLAA